MAVSANAIVGGAVAAAGVVLLVIATPAEWARQSALAAPPSSAQLAPAAETPPIVPAPSIAAGGGVTLQSVNIKLPASDRTSPGGAGAYAINNNCLICHSAGMVLTQPSLSRADWQAEVEKMRDFYKAPIAAKDVPVIVDYLINLSARVHKYDDVFECAFWALAWYLALWWRWLWRCQERAHTRLYCQWRTGTNWKRERENIRHHIGTFGPRSSSWPHRVLPMMSSQRAWIRRARS